MQPKRSQKDRPRRSFFRPPPAAGAGAISRPGASAFFVSDGPISSNSGRNGGKNAGRNCVSALPQRAMPGSDLLRILAGITFYHRCQSKGLCLRSPARRLTRPLASATVGVFASAGLGEFRRSGGEQVLRLRAQAGAFRAPARVTFFCCQKKVTKENHLDLRSKDPLARYGAYKFSGAYSRIECSG